MARREKSPSIGGRRRCRSVDYVGEKKGERIRILFVGGSFLLSRNQVTVALFISFLFPFFFSATRPLSVIKRKGEGPKTLHRDPSKRSRTASKASLR